MCLMKRPSCGSTYWGWRQGSKGRWTMSLSTLQLTFTTWRAHSECHEGHLGENETFPWLVLIFPNEEKHHKGHLAFCSSSGGCSGESPTFAFNRASQSSSLELTVTQSWTLNCTPGFHADTKCTSHGWESQQGKNSQSWQWRGVASSSNSTLIWCEQWADYFLIYNILLLDPIIR